ncbi:hypothetical protein D3C78_1821160 [compost metagenome]
MEQDKGLTIIDRKLWQDLRNRSGMLALMDVEARELRYKSMESKDQSAINEEKHLQLV